ncbi:hypothetical protein ACP70R_043951 [Stipagrostis hirtigluma subsp. patula]
MTKISEEIRSTLGAEIRSMTERRRGSGGRQGGSSRSLAPTRASLAPFTSQSAAVSLLGPLQRWS